MITRLNLDNFDSEIAATKGPYLIKFFSPTCGPCSSMKPVFQAFAEQKSDFKVFEIDTMESPHLAEHFGIRGVPFTAFCEGRELIYSITGLTPLRDLLYVAENINDSYLRQFGHFKPVEEKSNVPYFALVILVIIAFYGAIIAFG